MRSSRTTAILATVGAAAIGYVAVRMFRRNGNEAWSHAPAFSERNRDEGSDFSSTRAAGPEAMRDPPREWTAADQASDESFPASDPPAVGSRVD